MALVSKPIWKQADMTSNGLAKLLVLKPTVETSRHYLERACKDAHPQTYEETSRHDLERTRKCVRPKTYEETGRHDLESACKGVRPETYDETS